MLIQNSALVSKKRAKRPTAVLQFFMAALMREQPRARNPERHVRRRHFVGLRPQIERLQEIYGHHASRARLDARVALGPKTRLDRTTRNAKPSAPCPRECVDVPAQGRCVALQLLLSHPMTCVLPRASIRHAKSGGSSAAPERGAAATTTVKMKWSTFQAARISVREKSSPLNSKGSSVRAAKA